ncbi:MAG: hypothetical protein RR817_10845 [Niameybacter sp.]
MEVFLVMTDLTKEQLWRSHINDCTQSGIGIVAWCKAHDLPTQQYHYWKRKFAKSQHSSQDHSVEWAPLIIQKPEVTGLKMSPIVIHLGQIKVELQAGFDKQALTELFQVLGILC